MKEFKSALIIFFILAISINAQDIKIFGDASIRPRYDANHNGVYGNSTDDFHYLYRARINLLSEIGDGWFFQAQLAHAGFGSFAFSGFERTEYRIPTSVDGALRPGIHFMQMYFGMNSKEWSLMGGIIPLDGIENPLLDVHYYPSRMVDIPYALFSVNGAVGAKGHFYLAGNRLDLTVLFDANEGKYVESPAGNELSNLHDNYTFIARYNIAVGEFTLSPLVMFAYANDSTAAPLTFGAIIKTPELAGIKFSLVAGSSNQSNVGTTEYSAFYTRLRADKKIGSGTATAWFDLAKRTDKKIAGDEEHNFTYMWLMYNFPIVKTEKGSISMAPTLRYATDKSDNVKDFSRVKAEVTITYKF